jgi:hypothetical protein
MPTQNQTPCHHSNQYSADSACMHCDGVIRHESWCTTQSAGAPGRVKDRRNIPVVNLAPSEGAKKEASAEASGKAFRARPDGRRDPSSRREPGRRRQTIYPSALRCAAMQRPAGSVLPPRQTVFAREPNMPHARSSTRRHGRRPRSHRSAEGLRSCPERVASALNVDISLVRQKRDMLKGISPKP